MVLQEYFDDQFLSKLNDSEFPPASAFASSLRDFEEIAAEDYEHSRSVYKEFGFRRLEDFVNLYVALDTCLLADVFETFR